MIDNMLIRLYVIYGYFGRFMPILMFTSLGLRPDGPDLQKEQVFSSRFRRLG